MDWKRVASIALFVVLMVAVVFAAPTPYANVVTFVAYTVYLAAIAVNGYRLVRKSETRKALVQYFASSMGGRMRASAIVGTGLVVTIISIIISAMIVAALFPALDTALANLTSAASQSQNPLIKALGPALPYLVGLILLGLIFYIVRSAIDRINPG